jgi:hypothetical protein
MAFNAPAGSQPAQDTGVPNFSGRSQETGPNRMFEALFDGLNNTYNTVTQIKDTDTQLAIEQEVRQEFDATNSDFGFDPPAALSDDIDRIATLQSALEQGKISEVNYYGRLATLSKQMRSRYPRYESIVDSTIQSVTGIRPANAFRDALMGEIRGAQESASNEQKFRRQFEKENMGEIGLAFPDDYWENPDKYPLESVQKEVSRIKAMNEGRKAEISNLELLAKQGSFNEEKAKQVLNRDFSFVVEAEMNKAIGANGVTFREMLADFTSNGSTDLETMTTNLAAAEARMRSSLFSRAQKDYIAKGIPIPQAEVNKAIDDAMYPLTAAKEAILGKDFKYAGKFATLNKDIADRSLNDLLKASPELRIGQGLSEINQTMGQEWLNRKGVGQKVDQTLDNITDEISGRMLLGTDTDMLKNTVKSGDQKVARMTLEKGMALMASPQISGERMTNLINQFFDPSSVDLMSGEVVSPDDLEKMYLTLTDPKITRAIKEKGTQEDFEKYTKYALEKFTSIPSIRAAAGTLNNASGMFDSLKLRYDEKSNRIVVESQGGFSMSSQRETFGKVLGTMNKTLQTLDPIAEANGVTVKDFLADQLQRMVEFEKVPGKGIFSWMFDSLESDEGTGTEGGQEDAAYIPISELSEDGGEIDFLGNDLNFEEPMEATYPEGVAVGKSERAGYITEGLVDRGLPKHVAEAFVLNMRDESGLDPGINERAPLVSGSRGGYGLYQLTGPRRRAYEEFSKRRGRSLDDIDTQLDFLVRELRTSESAAARRILSTDTKSDAAIQIVRSFLRPAESHRRSRERRYARS